MSPDWYGRLQQLAELVIAVCLLLIVGVEYLQPFFADLWYRDAYKRLAVDCDLAMHDEVILRPGTAVSKKDAMLSTTATVGLAVCHEYDKMRKRMLILGVTENRLALHGLEALESEQIPVERMVEPHRMDRF